MRFAGMSLVLLTLTSALAAQEPTADELLRAVERKLVAVNETAGPSVACVVVSRSEKYPKPTSDAPGSLGGFDAKQFLTDNPKATERLAKALDLSAVNFDEAGFRYALNYDAMATDKLAEGIRAFALDAVKLEQLMEAA